MNNVDKAEETWERLPGESGAAYAAFSAYRDFGPDRNIRKAVEHAFKNKLDQPARIKRYRMWKKWSHLHAWVKRAEDYDRYTDRLVRAGLRKNIQKRRKLYRKATGTLLQTAIKTLAATEPSDIPPGAVADYIRIAIKTDLAVDQFMAALYPESTESRESGQNQQTKPLFPLECKGL